jgi:hypothetical protein
MIRIVSKEDSELRLSRRGTWFHQSREFENLKVIRFFHTAIRRDSSGEYYLYNKYDDKEENVYFEVEDTAYFIWQVDFDEDKKSFSVTTNTGATDLLDLTTLAEDEHGVMYCRIQRDHRARFSPKALEQLSEHAVMDEDKISIEKTGTKIVISSI